MVEEPPTRMKMRRRGARTVWSRAQEWAEGQVVWLNGRIIAWLKR